MATPEAVAKARASIAAWQRQEEQRLDHTIFVCADISCGHEHDGPHGFCKCGCTYPIEKLVG